LLELTFTLAVGNFLSSQRSSGSAKHFSQSSSLSFEQFSQTGKTNSMFAKLNLKQKLVSAFLIVALIVLAVAFVGSRGTQDLSNYINTLSQTSLPSI